jgi:hypothetical protein
MADRQGLRFAPAPGSYDEAPAAPAPSQEGAPAAGSVSVNPNQRPALNFSEPYAEMPRAPTDWQDVGMSAATRAGKAGIGVAIGGPGSVEETVAKDIPEFLRNRYYGMQERMDLISPEEEKRLKNAPLYSGQNEGQAKGYNSPITNSPTYKAVTETVPKVAPVLGYKSKTPEGKIAGEAAEFAVQGMNPIGLAGDVARGVSGAARLAPGTVRAAAKDVGSSLATGAVGGAGGAGGELLGQRAQKEGTSEAAARLAGTFGGAISTGALMHVGNAFVRPGSVAQNKLMEHVYQDISRGESPMTIDQFNTAIRNGTPVTIMDLAGPRTSEFLAKYAEYNNANINQVQRLNEFLKNRLPEGNARVQSTINQQYGRDIGNSLDAPGMQESVARAGKIERDRMYDLLRDHPNAQTITVDELGDVRNNRVWRDAEKFAKDAANHEEWGIQVPRKTAEVPATPGTILDEYGQPIMKPGAAAKETPGNLAYYDQLKRGLDGIIAKAEAANDQNTLVQATAAKNKLVDLLDKKVPDITSRSGELLVEGYGRTRDLASETFKAASAPEAGYKFFGAQNAFRRQDIEKILRTYNPEQRELFSAGYAARLNEIAGQPNGVKALAEKFLTDRNFQERARVALGQEAYDTFRAKAFSENLLRNAEQINFLGNKPMNLALGASGAGGAGATAMTAADFLMHNFSADTAGRAAVAALGTAALGAGMNVAEKRMASQLIPLATATDPASMTRFVRLLDGSPMARTVFNKMNTALNTAQQQAVKGYLAQPEQPQQRKLGGRTGYASGGSISPDAHADKLISAAERAHKGWQAETKPLLGASDNTIARALEIANANT